LYKITGRHSEETLEYVIKIRRWYEELSASNRGVRNSAVDVLVSEPCLASLSHRSSDTLPLRWLLSC
jgi:hypothetical protein